MRRLLLIGLFACAALSAVGQDAKKIIEQRYDSLNTSIIKNDFPAIQKWLNAYCAVDFKYTSHDKKTYKLKDFIKGMNDITKQITKVNTSTYKVTAWKIDVAKVVATVHTEMGAQVKFDGKTLRLSDKSDSSDLWVKVGSDWKLKSMIQSKADTQLFEK